MLNHLLLSVSFFISALGIVFVGLGGSDQNIVTNFIYVLALPYLALLFLGVAQWRKQGPLIFSAVLLFVSVFYSIFVLASHNCSRCITPDMRSAYEMQVLKDELARIYQEVGEYPQTLPPQHSPILHQDRYRYARTGDLYELCTKIKKHTFYGIPTNKGEEHCVQP